MDFSTHSKLAVASMLGMSLIVTTPLHSAEPATDPQAQLDVEQVREYGPTKSTDTFWRIANNVRPDKSVSIYQVMAAIFQANPHAFASDNYNSLEKGAILVIPPKSVMAAIPRQQALQKASADDQGWKSGQQTTKPSQVETPAETSPVVASPSGVTQKALQAAKQETQALRQQLEDAKAQLSKYQKVEPELKQKLAELQAEKTALLEQQRLAQQKRLTDAANVQIETETETQIKQDVDAAMSNLESELKLQSSLVQKQQQQIASLESRLQRAQNAPAPAEGNLFTDYWYAFVAGLLALFAALAAMMFSKRQPKEENYQPVPSVQSQTRMTEADQQKRQQATASAETKDQPKEKKEIRKITLPDPIIAPELDAPELDLDEGAKLDKSETKEDINQLLERLLTQKPVDAQIIPPKTTGNVMPQSQHQQNADSSTADTQDANSLVSQASTAAALVTGVTAVEMMVNTSSSAETSSAEISSVETTEQVDPQAEQQAIAPETIEIETPNIAEQLEAVKQDDLAAFEAELTAQIQQQASDLNQQQTEALANERQSELPTELPAEQPTERGAEQASTAQAQVQTQAAGLSVQHEANVEMDEQGVLEFTLTDSANLTIDDALESLSNEEGFEQNTATNVALEGASAEITPNQTHREFIDIGQLLQNDEQQGTTTSYTLELADDDFDDPNQGLITEVNFNEKLNLAQVYMEMGESSQAEELLLEVSAQGSEDQKQEAVSLLSLLKKS